MIEKFSEVEEKLDTMVKKYDYYSIYVRDGRDIAPEVREATTAENNKNITNYKESILFTKKHEEYVKYRKMDMELDTEKVEINKADSPRMCDLNFNHEIIGSDETGTGEIFKPMVVTAVYLENEEQVESCIKLGITDSKKIKNQERVYEIAKEVTGITDWKSIKGKKLIESDFFAIRIVTNKELNERCVAKTKPGEAVTIEGAKKELLNEAHVEVLNALYKKHDKAVVVVDDFTDEVGKKNDEKEDVQGEFRSALAQKMPGADVYLTTKGDSKIMSVALASMISYYISHLGYEDAKAEFIKLCRDESCKFPAGAGLEESVKNGETKFIDCITAVPTNEFREYMDTYAKRYYKNVVEIMKNY